jgi:hypothetical protein
MVETAQPTQAVAVAHLQDKLESHGAAMAVNAVQVLSFLNIQRTTQLQSVLV